VQQTVIGAVIIIAVLIDMALKNNKKGSVKTFMKKRI
jgi:hypothetical protein